MITNPILPGFHPDPSILRVGDDYYIATSTFEWFPGVALFHSRDLAHWKPIGHVLTRRSQLDLRGVGDSAGPWAPSLSHDGKQFFLVVCQVRTRVGPFKDMRVMLYTADAITGPWSDPVELGRSGFDPSLFHDPDTGRKWLANIQWDYRKGKPRFGGIVIQEYDAVRKSMIGPLHTVLTKDVLLEGPNLYKREGWYYLMLAEGGTGWNHGISMARSRCIEGPYEIDPQPLVLTTRENPGSLLQKAGHGEIVQTPAGEWFLVHLAGRPIYPDRRCLLGRETCLQRVVWSEDGWLRLAAGGCAPALEVSPPAQLASHPWPIEPETDHFDAAVLSPHWQSLRVPIEPSWANLTDRAGWLRLRGRESIASLFEQSVLARRIESAHCTIETRLQFRPTHFTQSAGLILYYDTRQNYYLRVSHVADAGVVVGLVQTDDGVYDELLADHLAINDWNDIYLRAEVRREKLQFSVSRDGKTWQRIGGVLDFSKLSDDYGSTLRFTGPMAGVCCQDLNFAAATADFDYFTIRNDEARPA
ncbi:MAG: glycoside hydrolase family 43 protein [Tepidisphaeraceae bacterium]